VPDTASVSITTVGDNVVDCYPDLGVMYPGGNTVNVAVHAGRLGAHVAYLGALGTDTAGRVVRDALADEGVDLSLLRVVDGPNARATVRIVGGNRHFVGGDAGVSRFRLTDGDLEVLGRVDLVHTGECSFIEDQLPLLQSVARRLSFDFSERPWAYVEALAPLVDVAIVSLPDSAADDAVALARRVRDLGPSVVAVTLGGAGAVLLRGGEVATAPAGRVQVVDTLGAGDAFIARLLVGLVRDEDPAALVAAATSFASAACTTYGAFGHEADLPEDIDLPDYAGIPGVTPEVSSPEPLSSTEPFQPEAPSAPVTTPSLAQEY
jgi:sugar/nucleoside kinase (ribokinase family)